jgi:hypothetical protein
VSVAEGAGVGGEGHLALRGTKRVTERSGCRRG